MKYNVQCPSTPELLCHSLLNWVINIWNFIWYLPKKLVFHPSGLCKCHLLMNISSSDWLLFNLEWSSEANSWGKPQYSVLYIYSIYSTLSFALLSVSQWLMEGHRGAIRLCWRNSKAAVFPVLLVQLSPSLPFIASFCPWSLSSVPSLSLHLSLKGTLGRQSSLSSLSFTHPLSACLLHILSPLPFMSPPIHVALVHVDLWLSVSPQ